MNTSHFICTNVQVRFGSVLFMRTGKDEEKIFPGYLTWEVTVLLRMYNLHTRTYHNISKFARKKK